MADALNDQADDGALDLDGRIGLWMEGRIFSIRTSTAETGGKCAVLESAVNIGQGPPLHRFRWEDILYVVLEGRFLFEIDDRRRDMGPGDTLFAPRGVLHSYLVTEGRPARYLMIGMPGNTTEFYMQAISEPALRNEVPGAEFQPLPMEVIHRVAKAAGLELIGPRIADMLRAEGADAP